MDVSSLTKTQKDAVESLKWGMDHFGSLATNRHVTRRTVMRLVEKGLAESVGMVEMCDDDGYMIDTTRWREGFRLTDLGLTMHSELMKWYDRQVAQEDDS